MQVSPPRIGAVLAFVVALFCPTAIAQDLRLGAFEREIAGLHEPVAAAVDADFNIYIVEAAAHRIRGFQRAGVEVRRFGEFGSAPGQLIAPAGIAIGHDGHLYVADAGNQRIQVFDRNGDVVRSWGRRGSGPGEFVRPAGIAVSDQGVLVSDAEIARIQVFDHSGVLIRTIGSFGETSGQLSRPLGLAVGSEGLVFVANADNNRIEVFEPDGAPVRRWGEWGSVFGLLNDPVAVALHDERVFVCDRVNHRIQVFSLDGKPIYQWGIHAVRPREGNGSLHYPAHIALAPAQAFAVVCEPLEDRVQLFAPRPPGDAEAPPLIPPGDAAGSHFGTRAALGGGLLAVTEQDGRGVIIYELRGREPIEIHRFGSFGPGNGKFRRPEGLALDPTGGRLVVSDLGQRRLQIFRLDRTEAREIRYQPSLSRLARTIEFDALERALPDHLRTGVLDATAIRLDRTGNLYVLDARIGRVACFGTDLTFRYVFQADDRNPFIFRRPTDFCLTPDESRWLVVDAEARRVIAFDRHGQLDSAFTVRPTDPVAFDSPFGIAASADGRIFVSDTARDRVLAFRPDGQYLTSWGTAGLGRVQFHKPRGLAIDDGGCLFVVDHGNHRCQILTLDGEFLDAFGSRFFVQPAKRGSPPTTQRKPATSRPTTTTSPAQPFALCQPATRPTSLPWQHAIVSNDGSYLIEFRTRPETIPMNDMFSIDLRVSRATPGQVMPPEIDVSADADMPEHLHGMNTKPKITRDEDGTFTVRGMQFHMSGYWEIYFDVSAAGVSERAQFGVTLE